MADIDIVSYLASKGYQGRQANGPQVNYPCFFECGEDSHSSKRKLTVNTEEGLYFCFVCGAAGGTYLLQLHFGDTPDKPLPGTDPNIRRKILNWATDTGAAMLTNNDDVLLHLLFERGLSFPTIVERRLGVVVPPWSLTGSLPEQFTRAELLGTGLVNIDGKRAGEDYFYNHLLIPYLQHGQVVGMRGRALGSGPKYLTGKGDHNRLYGVDSLDGADDVVITEGEFDCMALQQHLRAARDPRASRFAVVGLSGVNGFPDGAEAYFSKVSRIYIGFDPDDAGERAAAQLKEKFGSNRARIIQLPTALPKADWSEYLLPIEKDATDEWRDQHPHAGHNWHDVMALLGNAAGKRVFSMREIGFEYRRAKEQRPQGIKTGFTRLDNLIAPGLLPGQVMVVLAVTGVGKTLFLCNLAWNSRQHQTLFISLEMTRLEVYERLHRIALFHNPRWTYDEIEDALSNIYIFDEDQLAEKEVDQIVEEVTLESGTRPEIAYIDYLGYYARGAKGGSQYEKVSNAVMSLKGIAKRGDLALVVPSQVNRSAVQGKPIDLDDARDSGQIEATADFLISIYRPDQALDPKASLEQQQQRQPTGKLNLAVLKSRHGNAGSVFSLQNDLLTLAIVDDDGLDAKRAYDHNKNFHWAGLTYEDLRKVETQPVQGVFGE